jgi:DNA polymerase-3 subunit gamma/tau
MSVSLAIKYRPQKFDEVVEQSATKVILKQQLDSGDIKNAYLFCGGAGTGKTTCARIFANEINKGKGLPIELDAASNNSVDDVREIIQQAKTNALDSEYKVFIMDEVHALSNNAWQAMLKILEEPPKKSIFIMCTTDPQKIPKTILSRVQRYNFQRISHKAIVERLWYVVKCEFENGYQIRATDEALDFIAKQAQGGMRDALTMLDKCLAYSEDLTIDSVVKALGMSDYSYMIDLLYAVVIVDCKGQIDVINKVYMSGIDLKQFIKDFTVFVLDCCKYDLQVDFKHCSCPDTPDICDVFESACKDIDIINLLRSLIRLQTDIKWDTNPKSRLEAWCITGE